MELFFDEGKEAWDAKQIRAKVMSSAPDASGEEVSQEKEEVWASKGDSCLQAVKYV